MCGIAGIVTAGPSSPEWLRGSIQKMAMTLRHRGPDALGIWVGAGVALGHTRLSIIDLSKAGCQPMREDTGRYTMVYNGEVYNFEILRRELEARGCRFHSNTDSEVVLYAYREWGARALERFNGMWAFAIWDEMRGELFTARDRAGKKPFYYTHDREGNFYFASEVKAFRALGMRFGIQPQAAFDFLTQGTYGHLNGKGFFAGVAQLQAAHSMVLRRGDVPRPQAYWAIPVVRRRDRLPYDAALRERFRTLLDDAVRLRLRADVPVGATLSGGLDSSTIVGLIERITGGAPLHLFTSLYPGSHYDETRFFDAVVARLAHPLVHRVTPEMSTFRHDLGRVLDHQEEPFGDTSILAHYYLMRCAREHGVSVILSGQGGDELLFGYPSMVHSYIGHLMGHGHLFNALAEANRWSAGSGIARRTVLASAIAHSLPLSLRDRIRSYYVSGMASMVSSGLRSRVTFLRFGRESGRNSIDDYIAQIFTRFSIPHLVHYDDRNAMAFGVEGRMPFLDHRLVEVAFSADYQAMVADGVTKRVLRDGCVDLLPPMVRARRDKVGFHTPLAGWLRAELGWIEEVMTDGYVQTVGVLDRRAYLKHLMRLRAGDDHSALPVWRGFIFHLWSQRFDVAPLSEWNRAQLIAA